MLFFTAGIFAACEKPEVYDEDAQFAIDESLIKSYVDASDVDWEEDPSGIYYHINEPGAGEQLKSKDVLEVNYVGRLLTDSIFSEASGTSTYKFTLENAIPGWRIGLPLIKKGGSIRLLIPSKLAYQDNIVGIVPINAVLNFEIDLNEVNKEE